MLSQVQRNTYVSHSNSAAIQYTQSKSEINSDISIKLFSSENVLIGLNFNLNKDVELKTLT